VATGTTHVIATSHGVQSAAFTLRVLPATQVPASVVITAPPSPASVLVGSTLQFSVRVLDTRGDSIPGAAVAWHSSDPPVASIDATGLARGESPGRSSITASIDSFTSPAVLLDVLQPEPNFTTEVQPIFDTNCAFSNCHGFSGGLTLSAGVSYSMLVNHRSFGSSLTRVAPGDPDNSFLYLKITGCQRPRCAGERMPSGRPPLAAAQIQLIHDWIAAGALP
jgi:hypothetical protein